jgi:hypothetical protein
MLWQRIFVNDTAKVYDLLYISVVNPLYKLCAEALSNLSNLSDELDIECIK